MAVKRHFHFNSSDGIHKIHGILWKPESGPIKGVVQIVHGMVEFVDRYDAFANYLCTKGFVVTGEDHLGHGQSVNDSSELGFFAEKNGMEYVISDNYHLKKHMEREFEGVPYFILGHSIGSFITRVFLTRYSNEVDGAIIMGTGGQPALLAYAGKLLTTCIAAVKGWHYRSKFVNNMAFGAYNKKFENPRTSYDWLTRDEKIEDAYMANPLCTFVFTLSAYKDLFDMVLTSGKDELMEKIRPNLPIFLVSGAKDPVGGFGLGVENVYDKMCDAGLKNVKIKLYEDGRHEILNEMDREIVYNDLAEWLMKYA